MTNNTTAMFREATEAGLKITDQLAQNESTTKAIAANISQLDPAFVVMVGRGSSDHAALFAKYLIEIETGLPVMNAAPSVATTFKGKLHLNRAVVIIISQSGRSPDLLEYATMARAQGAYTIALVNDTSSPIAEITNAVIPLAVGEEIAVAATKSYLGSLSALIQLVSELTQSASLQQAVEQIPQAMKAAVDSPNQLTYDDLMDIDHCVVTGRGFGFAIGTEMALKLKEVCAIQAECFSSAEFLHGPVRIVSDNFHVLDILLQDETYQMHRPQSALLQQRGAVIKQMSFTEQWIHPRVAPLMIMQRFYLDLELISRTMGFNPDQPEGLSKVTETL